MASIQKLRIGITPSNIPMEPASMIQESDTPPSMRGAKAQKELSTNIAPSFRRTSHDQRRHHPQHAAVADDLCRGRTVRADDGEEHDGAAGLSRQARKHYVRHAVRRRYWPVAATEPAIDIEYQRQVGGVRRRLAGDRAGLAAVRRRDRTA